MVRVVTGFHLKFLIAKKGFFRCLIDCPGHRLCPGLHAVALFILRCLSGYMKKKAYVSTPTSPPICRAQSRKNRTAEAHARPSGNEQHASISADVEAERGGAGARVRLLAERRGAGLAAVPVLRTLLRPSETVV